MSENLISFDQFEWFDFTDDEVSKASEYLKDSGMLEVAEALPEMPTQRPFFDLIDSTIVAVLQFPSFGSESNKSQMVQTTLRIILTHDRVVTIHSPVFPSAERVRTAVKSERIDKSISSSKFVGELLWRVVSMRFQFIDELTGIANELERGVFDCANKRDLIGDLMELKMTLSKARLIALPQKGVVEQIAREVRRRNFDDEGLLTNVELRIQHIITLLDGLKERSDIVTEANEAFLTHSLNATLKLLTIFSVLMITPTLIAGVFGMNVRVPWQENQSGFLIVSLILGTVTLGSLAFLKLRRWF